MKRIAAIAILGSLTLASAAAAEQTKTVTWTGWFSDAQCARVTNGETKPNNTTCVKKCLEEGAAAVFISEQAKAIFTVKDHPSVKEDVGYRVELTGAVDEAAGTIAVTSVKRLSEVVNICAVPQKKK